MLSLQLKELENDGIITKKIYPVVPPKTEYQVSELGKSLEPVINEMEKWGISYNERNAKWTWCFLVTKITVL